MMKRTKCLLLATLFFAMTAMAIADDSVLFNQDQNDWNGSAQRSDYYSGSVDNRVSDDFTLATTSNIKQVTIRGHHNTGFNGFGLSGMTVKFYGDNSGSLGSLLKSVTVSGAQLTNSGDLYTLNFSGDSGNWFQAAGGTTYWLSVQGLLNSGEPSFLAGSFLVNWNNDSAHPSSYSPVGNAAITANGGTQGGSWGRHWVTDMFNGDHWAVDTSSTEQKMDLNFTLVGEAVPEPGTCVMLASGLIALGAFYLRRRAR